MNLVDRDLTEHQITQTLTLSRLHAQLEQTRGIRLFTHTQHVDWSSQEESDCLITLWSKQEILPFNAVRFVRIRGVTSWNGSMTNTAWLRSTHRRCFSCWNLVLIGKYGELEIVNIPVTQIVEEITEVNILVTQIVEEITELNILVTQIVEEITELNIPVPQIVEEIAEVSKSSIE